MRAAAASRERFGARQPQLPLSRGGRSRRTLAVAAATAYESGGCGGRTPNHTMFEDHFGLTAKPFGKTPDPSFLFESRQHKEALARLEYAVEEKELALLVGDIGSGKTTLSRALSDRDGDARTSVGLI